MVDPRELSALSRLLDAALDLPDDDARARWMAAFGPEQELLRPKLEKLLAMRSTPVPAIDDGPAVGGLAQSPLSPRLLGAGHLVGPYVLIRELGLGGMSSVWLGRDERVADGVLVALKLPAVSLDSEAFLARFAREREFLQRLQHPGIAKMVDAGVSDAGQHYLALEYVEGSALDAYCAARRLDVRSRIAVFLQVLTAVQHAHSRSVLHRDLKPSNILVTPSGEVRLLDFGIAKTLVGGQADETELTAQWGRAMTRDFASPEQLVGGTVTVRSDIYSLGVILFELLCGERPSRPLPLAAKDATTALPDEFAPLPSEHCRVDSVVAQSEGGATRLARLLAGDIDEIVSRTLRHEARERYPDVSLLSADLSRVLAHEPVGTRLQRWRFRIALLLRRQRAAVSGASLLLLAVGLLGHSHRLAADIEARFAPAVPEAAQTAVVSVGAEDYQRLFGATSPLDPLVLRRLLARILEGQPAVVGVDIDTSSPSFATLRGAFDAAALRRIVWGRDIAASDRADSLPAPRAVLGSADAAVPLRSALAVSIVDGSAGIVRWFRRTIQTTTGPLPAFAAALADSIRPSAEQDDANHVRNIRVLPTGRIELPASVVLAEGFEWQDRIRGRVVLLGGRYDRADVHPTALGLMHGIEIQANAVETQLSGADYTRPHWWAILIIGLIDLAATIAFFERLGFVRAALASLGFGLALALALAATGAFPAWSYAILATVAVLLNQLVLTLWLRLREPRARLIARLRRHIRDRPDKR